MSDPSSHQLDPLRYAEEHAKELLFLHAKVRASAGTQRAFQALPRHRRRRTMSHNLYRIPSRLRNRAKAEMQTLSAVRKSAIKSRNVGRLANIGVEPCTGIPLATPRPLRKVRRNPAELRRRAHAADGSRWLEAHLYFARRMHMEHRWGWVIPASTTQRGTRAAHRFSKHEAVVSDMSFTTAIQLRGHEEAICSALAATAAPDNGTHVGRALLCSPAHVAGRYVAQADIPTTDGACPVDVLFLRRGATAVACVYAHPSATEGVYTALAAVSSGVELVCLENSTHFVLCGPRAVQAITRAVIPFDATACPAYATLAATPYDNAIPPYAAFFLRALDPNMVALRPLEPAETHEFPPTTPDSMPVPAPVAGPVGREIFNSFPSALEAPPKGSRADLAQLDAVAEEVKRAEIRPAEAGAGGAAGAFGEGCAPDALIENRPIPDGRTAAVNARRRDSVCTGTLPAEGPDDAIGVGVFAVPGRIAGAGGCARARGTVIHIVTQPGCATALLRRLVGAGARLVGADEWAALRLAQGLREFPAHFPETTAGFRELERAARGRFERFLARPPAKRVPLAPAPAGGAATFLPVGAEASGLWQQIEARLGQEAARDAARRRGVALTKKEARSWILGRPSLEPVISKRPAEPTSRALSENPLPLEASPYARSMVCVVRCKSGTPAPCSLLFHDGHMVGAVIAGEFSQFMGRGVGLAVLRPASCTLPCALDMQRAHGGRTCEVWAESP
eukprot:gnl/Chilomastix_cuspidata/3089.p1 GENE.gnl/Chilomastix_cuspidata/3089~~gnl/Chilomastix_cuspidata/3089.p1  ORF type:complete len:744 (-),score=113.11 gnl/Chilomastix_cuspidata/3089:94-2298(-)